MPTLLLLNPPCTCSQVRSDDAAREQYNSNKRSTDRTNKQTNKQTEGKEHKTIPVGVHSCWKQMVFRNRTNRPQSDVPQSSSRLIAAVSPRQ